MASMLNLPNADEKPVLADFKQPQLDESIFRRGDLKGTGDGMVAMAQGLAAYGQAQTNAEIESIKSTASIGQAAMSGIAQMAGKLKQSFKENGGEDQIAYQFDAQSGEMRAVGPGQPFADASNIFSGGAIGESLLGGFFSNSSRSGNYTAPTTQEEGQEPAANAGEGKTTGPGTLAQATIMAGPQVHLNNMKNDLSKIALDTQGNPQEYTKQAGAYLAKSFELSSSLGKAGRRAWDEAFNFSGNQFRQIQQNWSTNKLKNDYKDTLSINDGLVRDIYSLSRTYDDSKQGFNEWFENSPQWKQLNDNIAGIVNNPALNSDITFAKGSNILEEVKDQARQQYVLGKVTSVRDKQGADAAMEWLKKETIENPDSSLSIDQKQTAYRQGINQIQTLTEQQKTTRAAAKETVDKMLTDLRQGGFKLVPKSMILGAIGDARKANYPEGALQLEQFAKLNNSNDVQTAFQRPPAKAVSSLFGPGGEKIVQDTVRSNGLNAASKLIGDDKPIFPEDAFNSNLNEMDTNLGLTPQESGLVQEHQSRFRNKEAIVNEDGSISTLKVATVNHNGREYNIPTVWGGKEHTVDEARKRAEEFGWDTYPSYGSVKEAEDRYVKQMHPYLDKDTQSYQNYLQRHSSYYVKPETYVPGGIPKSGSAAHYSDEYVFGGMKPSFRDKLYTMAQAAKAEGVPFSVHSGFRSQEHQDSLFAHSDGSGHWVAKHSHHTAGDAADLSGDLNWAHRNAARFGLNFPMSWEKWHIEEAGSRDQQKYDYSQGPVSGKSVGSAIFSSDRVSNAIFGQESGWNPNIGKSVDGAAGIAQITPGTFKQFAHPGERIDNPADNARVGQRIIDHYMQKYNGDAARVAVAYFSGEGNVSPMGYNTPWKQDRRDGNGKSVSSYVNDVMGRLYKDRSGSDGKYMPNMPDDSPFRGLGEIDNKLFTTYAGPASPVPVSVDDAVTNLYHTSDFVHNQVNDVNTRAKTYKSLLPGIESQLRNGIEYDPESLSEILQFARAFPDKLPGVYEKLNAINEASQHIWRMNGKDLNQWMKDVDEKSYSSSDLATKRVAAEAMEMTKGAMKLQKEDPWEYAVRAKVTDSKPLDWAEVANYQSLGAQNPFQVVSTQMDQRRKMGAGLLERNSGVGNAMAFAYPDKDLNSLADFIENAPPEMVGTVLNGIRGNIKSPYEMARFLENKRVSQALFGFAKSDDLGKALPANQFIEAAHDMSPVIFRGNFGDKAVANVKSFMNDARYYSPKAAMEMQQTARLKSDQDPVYKNFQKQATKDAAEFTPAKVMASLGAATDPSGKPLMGMDSDSFFHRYKNDGPVTPDSMSSKSGENAMTSLYRDIYVKTFSATGDAKVSKTVAAQTVLDSFSRSKFTGGHLMWHSPENVYGQDQQKLQEFTQGLNKFVYQASQDYRIRLDSGSVLLPSMLTPTQGTMGFGAKPGVYLLSDMQTATDRINMRNPSYMLQVRDSDGKWHLLLDEKKNPVRYGLPNDSGQPTMPTINMGQ